jgi:outer membrane autotransporter protein
MPNLRIGHALPLVLALAFLTPGGGAQADGPYGRAKEAYVPPPPPPPPFTWAGFYIGGNIGGAWANGTFTDNFTGVSFDTDHSGFIGGGQLGFNVQIRNLVFGVEWDFDWTSISETSNGVIIPFVGTLQASAETDWVTTLAARAGLTLDRWLVYMKVGGGWAHDSASLTNLTTGAVASSNDTRGGLLVGAGVEYAFTSHWTARAEYSFLDLSDRTVTGPLGSTFTFDRDIQMLKIGLNYKF